MRFLRKSSEEPRIDLTPMVDVVFLLLIFFMISTTFVESPGISIKLPEASSQSVEREPQELKIYLSRDGDVYYLDRKISINHPRSSGITRSCFVFTPSIISSPQSYHQ